MKRSASALLGVFLASAAIASASDARAGIAPGSDRMLSGAFSFTGLTPEEGVRPADPWIVSFARFFALPSNASRSSGFYGIASPAHRMYGDGEERPDDGDFASSFGDLLAMQLGEALAPPAVSGCELVFDAPTLQRWESDLWIGAPWVNVVAGGHTDKDGSWVEYDQIPRRPDRPEWYGAYRYPLANPIMSSGYDLDLPDELQRRGKMTAVGHGGVDLAEKKGTPVTMIRLDHQVGDAEVIYVGWLFGETVVTRHTLREGGRKRDYVLLFGHLQEAAEGLRRGQRVREGELVGLVGDTASPEFVHLHLEARRLRDGIDAWRVGAWNINARELSVVTDPRNVLPLRAQPRHAAHKCAPRLMPRSSPSWLGAMKLSIDAPVDLASAQ
jgi:hypothetical protein